MIIRAETLEIVLDRESVTPQYQQIKNQIQGQIEAGRLHPGTRLPGSRPLAAVLGVARISIITAYQMLEQEHWLESHERRGLFVAQRVGDGMRAGYHLQDGDYGSVGNEEHRSRGNVYPDLIQFSLGSLPPEFMPTEAMRLALRNAVDADVVGILSHDPTEGYLPLRRAIGRWVAQFDIRTQADDVLITGGCQQAIDLVVQALIPPGGAILTTDPTYVGLIEIARARGLELLSIPYQSGELDFKTLDAMTAAHNPRLFYVMPSFHNPTGAVLPMTARRRLLAWSKRFDVPILEDGVYDGLRYDLADLPPLKALDEKGDVLYASGFSKTVAPGSRIGYLVAGERWQSRILRVKQAGDISTPGLHQRAMTRLITDGTLSAHLDKVRRACQVRRDAFLNEWQVQFGDWPYTTPHGGLYLWATMPTNGVTMPQLLTAAKVAGVDFVPGAEFSPRGDAASSRTIRLNFATHSATVMIEGLRRLRYAFESVQMSGR